MAYTNVTVTNSATLIVPANCSRKQLSIVNASSTTVYLGGDTSVTASNGLPLWQYSTRDQGKLPESYFGPVYGITASGTADVRYWEFT